MEEVVATAASRIENDTREDWQFFRAWAWQGEEKLGHSFWSVDTKDLTQVDNLSVCKPDNHLQTIKVAFFSGDTQLKNKYSRGKARVDLNDAFETGVIYSYEDATHIHFNSENVDRVRIQYFTLPLDGDGEPLIPRHHIDALSTWIEYHYWKKKQNFAMAGMLKNEWKFLAKNARAKNKMPNMAEGTEVIREWMSMFQGNFNKYRND